MRFPARCTVLFAVAALAIACSDGSEPAPASPPKTTSAPAKPAPPKPTEPTEPVDLVALGKQTYLANCIACHNPDPSQDGALGPAVTGSSQELLEARVLRAQYPEGYKPKRDTGNMVPMPYLESKIPALAAYLNAPES